MELLCKVQNYDWGKLGQDSVVAKLLSSADPHAVINDQQPYAELWMGTHPNGPSLIIERGILLQDYLKDNHDAIGPVVMKHFGVNVPFLLKVLSIRKALSIQAHPKKEHAEELHKLNPEMYKDPNHKPELAIALTPFEALCGFRPINEIKSFLKKLPELQELLSADSLHILLNESENENVSAALKGIFHSLMVSDKKKISETIQTILKNLDIADQTEQTALLYSLVKRLYNDYPGDVGCFAPYFLNYLELKPGQAIYLKPNLPHAYISGDCIECMACSDNVVRAGLTPKYIDVPTLVDMLDYTSYTKDELNFTPELIDENSCIWKPPVPDFAVVKIKVQSGDSYNTANRATPCIILITSGSGEVCDTEPIKARPGTVVFLKASRQLTLTPEEGSHLEAYQAVCNV